MYVGAGKLSADITGNIRMYPDNILFPPMIHFLPLHPTEAIMVTRGSGCQENRAKKTGILAFQSVT